MWWLAALINDEVEPDTRRRQHPSGPASRLHGPLASRVCLPSVPQLARMVIAVAPGEGTLLSSTRALTTDGRRDTGRNRGDTDGSSDRVHNTDRVDTGG
jgi:hypothetical protein